VQLQYRQILQRYVLIIGKPFFGCMQCLAAGSSIMNREVESASMRPLARSLTRHLDSLRSLLREQCFRNQNIYTEKVREIILLLVSSLLFRTVVMMLLSRYYELCFPLVLLAITCQHSSARHMHFKGKTSFFDPQLNCKPIIR
jgi:hypothetical protein